MTISSDLPLVSVIIPTFNCAQYLPDAIESALSQTYSNVEVLIVNDGSTDQTDQTIQRFLDRIVYLKQENRGLSAARNVGFCASKGGFVCFLDADDILLREKFERQLDIFTREPDLGVVISGYIDVEADGQTENQVVEKPWHRDALRRLLDHEVFPPHAALIRREVLERSSLFPEDIDTAESQEDWQLWLDLALNGVQFSSVPEPLCKYRRRSGSISSDPLKHLDGAHRVVDWLRQDSRAVQLQREVERLAAIVEMERVARAWQLGKRELAVEILKSAIRDDVNLWREPQIYLRLFRRSLSASENAQWSANPDPKWFHNRVFCEILPWAHGKIPHMCWKALNAAAYLALGDIAYGAGEHRIRHYAITQALVSSPQVCFSSPGNISTLRGLLGPRICGTLARMFRNLAQ